MAFGLVTRVFRVWHRIAASRRPRVATGNSPRGQPQTAQRSMRFDGFDGIGGTGRGKTTASSQPGAEKKSVEPNWSDKNGFNQRTARFSKASASTRASFLSSVSVKGPTLECSRNTKSQCGNSCRRVRNASRMTRLMALRVTALAAKRLAIISPRRAVVASPEISRGVVTTNKAPLAMRLPLRALAYSEGRCKRAAGVSVARMGVGAKICIGATALADWLIRPGACGLWRGAH